jgi:exodeoxyribonuclease VII small subunit
MPKASKPSNTQPESDPLALNPKWNYEQAVSEVETIIARIELGELELADVFDQFNAAVQQLRQCEQFLNQQRNRVDLLIETLNERSDEF